MKVYVKQDKISFFGRRFIVYENQLALYSIKRRWLVIKPKYNITDYQTGEKIGTLENKLGSFKANALINLPNATFKFDQPEGLNSMFYKAFNLGEENLNFVFRGNKGYSGSIFLNKQQIGQWQKNKLVIFDGDTYELDLDYDTDILFMGCSMVLIDTYRISITVGGDIGFEIGNIGKGLGRRKKRWKPKKGN